METHGETDHETDAVEEVRDGQTGHHSDGDAEEEDLSPAVEAIGGSSQDEGTDEVGQLSDRGLEVGSTGDVGDIPSKSHQDSNLLGGQPHRPVPDVDEGYDANQRSLVEEGTELAGEERRGR